MLNRRHLRLAVSSSALVAAAFAAAATLAKAPPSKLAPKGTFVVFADEGPAAGDAGALLKAFEEEEGKFLGSVENAKRYHRPLSVILLDIDHFKVTNDTWGHSAGDATLRQVAEAMRASLRASDVAARYGGDEFVAILPETAAQGAFAAAEKIRQMVAANDSDSGHNPTSVTLGIAELGGGDDWLLLLEHADRALYAGKKRGRNCTALWTPGT